MARHKVEIGTIAAAIHNWNLDITTGNMIGIDIWPGIENALRHAVQIDHWSMQDQCEIVHARHHFAYFGPGSSLFGQTPDTLLLSERGGRRQLAQYGCVAQQMDFG